MTFLRRPNSPDGLNANGSSHGNAEHLEKIAKKLIANKQAVKLVRPNVAGHADTRIDKIHNEHAEQGKSTLWCFAPGPKLSVPASWGSVPLRTGCTPTWNAYAAFMQSDLASMLTLIPITMNAVEELQGQAGLLASKGNNAFSAVVMDASLQQALDVPVFELEQKFYPNVRGSILHKPDGTYKVFPLTGPVTPEKMAQHKAEIMQFLVPQNNLANKNLENASASSSAASSCLKNC